MKNLERRYKSVLRKVGNPTILDNEYTENDFKKWAEDTIEFWYSVDKPFNIREYKDEIESEIYELEKLAREIDSKEGIYL